MYDSLALDAFSLESHKCHLTPSSTIPPNYDIFADEITLSSNAGAQKTFGESVGTDGKWRKERKKSTHEGE